LLLCLLLITLGASRLLDYTQALAQQLYNPAAYIQAMESFQAQPLPSQLLPH